MPKKSKMNSENNELYIRMVKVLKDYSDKFSHPIKHKELAEMDEYNKSLYFRMLCMLTQCENTTNDKQIWFLNRLLEGNVADEKLETYTVKALEIDTDDVEAFVNVFQESIVRLYFLIDALIILNLSEINNKQTEMVANIADFLKISERDLTCVSLLTKAILLNDIAIYDEAKTWTSSETKHLDLSDYIRNFYQGNYSLDEEIARFYAPSLMQVELHEKYNQKFISFENCVLNIDKTVEFKGCDTVIFKNCQIVGNGTLKWPATIFKNISNIEFNNCKLTGFADIISRLDECLNVVIEKCNFCDCTVERFRQLFKFDSPARNVVVCNNLIKNCHVENCGIGVRTSFFMDFPTRRNDENIKIVNNQIVKCSWDGSLGKLSVFNNKRDSMVEENNIIIECADDVGLFDK